MLNDIWGAAGMKDTCVYLSTLLPTSDPTGAQNRIGVNDQFRQLVSRRAGEGKCIYLADMGNPDLNGAEYFKNPEDYCASYFKCDGVHPNV